MKNQTGWFPFSKSLEFVQYVVNMNWRSLPKDVTEAQANAAWSWARNSRCKYIGIRIDMRDGHCMITDRDGKAITWEQLEYQLDQHPNAAYPRVETLPVEEWAKQDLGEKLLGDLTCHIGQYIEDPEEANDLLRHILVSLRQDLRETKTT